MTIPVPNGSTLRVALKLYQSNDHLTDSTSKTLAITISKNGAAFGNPSAGATNATEIGNGWYYVDLSTTDTGTNGPLVVRGTASSSDNSEIHFYVVNANNGGFAGVPNVVAGASAGLLISGTNAGTTTLGALTITGATTHTGNVTCAAGVTITQSTLNGAGLSITGNGTGAGVISTGGATGIGMNVVGGGTSGDGIKVTTTSGHGINLAPVGTSKHGLFATGGNGGTSDGVSLVAGTGGVDLRANQTGNLVGTVSTLTTYTGNTPQTGDSYARLGAPVAASISADIAEVATDTDTLIAGVVLTTAERNNTANNVLDIANGVETGYTLRQALRLFLSALASKAHGLDIGTPVFRDINDTKDRISATTDTYGNRSAVTYDVT